MTAPTYNDPGLDAGLVMTVNGKVIKYRDLFLDRRFALLRKGGRYNEPAEFCLYDNAELVTSDTSTDLVETGVCLPVFDFDFEAELSTSSETYIIFKKPLTLRDRETACKFFVQEELALDAWVTPGERFLHFDPDPSFLVVPSTNNFHGYWQREMPVDYYLYVMEFLVELGFIQEGYFAATERDGFGCLRLPHEKKKEPF